MRGRGHPVWEYFAYYAKLAGASEAWQRWYDRGRGRRPPPTPQGWGFNKDTTDTKETNE